MSYYSPEHDERRLRTLWWAVITVLCWTATWAAVAVLLGMLFGCASVDRWLPQPPPATPLPIPPPLSPTPPPSMPPAPLVCAEPEPVWGTLLGKRTPTQRDNVEASRLAVMAAHPELVYRGQILGWTPADPADQTGHRNAMAFLRLVADDYREHFGRCAWVTDELLVVGNSGDAESYRLVNFGGGRVWDAPNAYNGDTEILVSSPPSICGPPTPGPIGRVGAGVHIIGPNLTTLDSTLLHGPDRDYCRTVGWTDGRAYCQVRPEGHPELETCTREYERPPTWIWSGPGAVNPANPWQFRIPRGNPGIARACSDNGVCSPDVMVKP